MPTTPPTISPAPEVPQRSVRATFGKLVDAFNTWKAASVSQFQAVATNCWNNAKEAYDSAVAAASWASFASDKAAAAAQSATQSYESVVAAAAAVNATPWVSGTTYQQYQNAQSKIDFKVYKKVTTAAASTGGATDPANDPVNWQVTGLPKMARVTRTANAMLRVNDLGSLVDITSGTFTQTFDTPATLGNGWYCYLSNTGTGDITIPASDGVTNWIMYPGEMRMFSWDGVSFKSSVLRPFTKIYAASATFSTPPGYTALTIEAIGGGGSGAATAYPSAACATGGAGGAYVYAEVLVADAGPSVPVAIGAGGSSRTGNSTLVGGIAGGDTTFGVFVTAKGGPGGVASSVAEGSSGTSVAYALLGSLYTEQGGRGAVPATNTPALGGSGIKSAAGGGSACGPASAQYTSFGGASTYAGNGGNANSPGVNQVTINENQSASPGTAPGGAGGGCRVAPGYTATSGAGARGQLIVRGKV